MQILFRVEPSREILQKFGEKLKSRIEYNFFYYNIVVIAADTKFIVANCRSLYEIEFSIS